MQAALSTLENATDEDGRPILDQTDEEGVTMRERLQQSNDQMASLRNDPRIRNSPIAGFLADRFGRRIVLTVCLTVFGVFGGLAALARKRAQSGGAAHTQVAVLLKSGALDV